MNPETAFRDAMHAAGIAIDENIIADGALHRFYVKGDKPGSKNGWYVLHANGVAAGSFGTWKDANGCHTWHAKNGDSLSIEERAELSRKMEQAKAQREAEREKLRAEANEKARELWEKGSEPPEDHAYLLAKQIKAFDIRARLGALLVPLRDAEGELHSLQFVRGDGTKLFLEHAPTAGLFHLIREPGRTVCIAEGYATGASIHMATGYAVVVAFTAGNLKAVAQAVKGKYPKAAFVICADNDQWTEGNPGLTRACEAAKAIGAKVATPKFSDLSSRPSDFNDLHRLEGLEAVRRPVEAARNEAKICSLDWKLLATKEPPPRQWAAPGWFGFGHITLMPGVGGIGKTLLAQQWLSSLALGLAFIDQPAEAFKCLMWACEDDHDELWRRQLAIAKWLGVPLADFANKLVIEARAGLDNTLVSTEFGRPIFTTLLAELREQALDYEAQVLVLDNAAQIYGAGENDRHAVTSFLNALTGALPGRAVMLLAHPSRTAGSEYSGPSAWEAVARTRLYLGRNLPDRRPEEESDSSDTTRYLSRRKANYFPRDWRRLEFRDGVLVPEQVEAGDQFTDSLREQQAERVVLQGLARLQATSIRATEAANSPQFLPRLLLEYKLAEDRSKAELAAAMRRLMIARKIISEVVGRYSNRSPMRGLKVAE